MVDTFEINHKALVDKTFPVKEVRVGNDDKPYFTEELRQVKRRRQRAYTLQGRRSQLYARLKQLFDAKLLNEARKYKLRIENEVREGKRGSGYKAIRKLGNKPGESQNCGIILPAYAEQNLTPKQSAKKLAEYFSSISQSVEPLNVDHFHPALRATLDEGRSGPKPTLSQHDVYRKILTVSKPNSMVAGDIPTPLLKKCPYLYAGPVTKIFNKIIQSGQWPRKWVKEETIVLSKLEKSKLPASEEDLRTISKTAWLSKCMENILGSFILPIIDPYLDPGQCGGLKKTSITHYLVKLLDFVHSTLDQRTPHCAVICTEDLSKAYNRGSHQMVVEDLFDMHLPGWTLNLICSYLSGRSCVLTFQRARSEEMSLPGGFGAGTWLGGLLFIVKFNGACLRPPIPRPLSGNRGIQLKYIDDSTQAASINLGVSLEADLSYRPRPLKYHERTQMKLQVEENVLQQELTKFEDFAMRNKLVINSKKCFVMLFTRSKIHAFPPEFSIGRVNILETKDYHKILGVTVQNYLRWTKQVDNMVKKATQTTWVLRRMKTLGVDQDTLVAFWKAEGRVHLELACPVWHSGLTVAQAQDLDRAQRVAMAAIAGRWEPSHTRQLTELSLERLGPRRVQICLTFAKRTAQNSIHRDMFVETGSHVRKGKSSKTYREKISRTATHFNSPLPYLTRLLNKP